MSSSKNADSTASKQPSVSQSTEQPSQQQATSTSNTDTMSSSYAGSFDQWDAASSTTASSLIKDYASTPETGRKSSIARAFEKAKSKLGGSDSSSIMSEEGRLEAARAKAAQKAERKEEYKKLGLDDKVKFGTSGSGGFNSM